MVFISIVNLSSVFLFALNIVCMQKFFSVSKFSRKKKLMTDFLVKNKVDIAMQDRIRSTLKDEDSYLNKKVKVILE
jgi:hypothetical protein